MSIAFLFPGQGSQHVGMGVRLAEAFGEARLVFEEVDDALGQKLSDLMREGPEGELTLTENAQPALMAVSLAASRVLEKQLGRPAGEIATLAAGHSLGEYSALTAMGALTIADSARLLKLRGQAMQSAVPVGEGAMAAILGPGIDDVRQFAADATKQTGGVCDIANDNAPGQVVVSGGATAVEAAMAIAKDAGVKRSVLLPVSAPFHCALMAPAAEAMAEALETMPIAVPARPVIANVTTAPVSDPDAIRTLLVEQICGTVRWRESMARLREEDGVERCVELGAGHVLGGLMKRIDRALPCAPAGAPGEIDALLESL